MPFLNLADLTVHTRSDGEGRTAVVFVNPLGTDLTIWEDALAVMTAAVRRVRYDKRGHGRTTVTPGPYSIDQLVDDLVRLLDAQRLDRAVVCGMSIGGVIAQRLAVRYPERVQALILCDTAARIGEPAIWTARIEAIRHGGIPSIADEVMERWLSASYRAVQPGAYLTWRNLLTSMPAEGYIGACAALRDADLSRDAAAIRQPTLVLCGAQDTAIPPGLVEDFAKAIRGAKFVLLENAGHLPCIEQPKRFAVELDRFMETLRLA